MAQRDQPAGGVLNEDVIDEDLGEGGDGDPGNDKGATDPHKKRDLIQSRNVQRPRSPIRMTHIRIRASLGGNIPRMTQTPSLHTAPLYCRQ